MQQSVDENSVKDWAKAEEAATRYGTHLASRARRTHDDRDQAILLVTEGYRDVSRLGYASVVNRAAGLAYQVTNDLAFGGCLNQIVSYLVKTCRVLNAVFNNPIDPRNYDATALGAELLWTALGPLAGRETTSSDALEGVPNLN